MANLGQLPHYISGELGFFLSQLRTLLFSSQQKAADHFYVDRSQITRYEASSRTIPDIGYVACLMRLIDERQQNPERREHFLHQFNRIAREHNTPHTPIDSWSMLCNFADEYMAERESRYAGSQVVQNFPPKVTAEEQTALLEERIGPASYYQLIGMDATIGHLVELLSSPEPPWVVAVTGLGGIGKSSLAHAVAQRIIYEQRVENVGWIDIRQKNSGFERWGRPTRLTVLDAESLYDQLLAQLVPTLFKSTGASQLSSFDLLQRRFKQIPHLVILDNLETLVDPDKLIAKLRLLVNPTKFLITSRTNLYEEPSVYHLPLPGLPKSEALALLQREARLRNIPRVKEMDNQLFDTIYDTVGGIPLALRLIAGQAQTRPIDTILAEMNQVRGDKNEAFFKFIFQDAWQHLGQRARAVLLSMLLSTHFGATIEYVAALCKLPLDIVRTTLAELTARNLVNDNHAATEQKLRYTIHNLTRAYLRHMTEPSSTPNQQVMLRQQTLNSMQYLQRQMTGTESVLPAEVQEQALQTLRFALNQLELWSTTRNFIRVLAPKMEQAGLRESWASHLVRGIRYSKYMRDRAVEAELRFHLGTLRQRRGNYALAQRELRLSAHIFGTLGLYSDQARALNRKAYVARLQGDFGLADKLANQALALLPANEPERAYSYLVRGTVELDRRHYEAATTLFQQSLEIWTLSKERRMVAWALTNLGAALRPLRRYPEAIATYTQAIQIFEQIEDPIHLAVAHMNLGNVHLTQEEPEKALQLYTVANRVFGEVQEELRLAQIHMNMGMAHFQLDHWQDAERCYTLCIEWHRKLGNVRQVANGLDALGLTYLSQRLHKKAVATFKEALAHLSHVSTSAVADPLQKEIEAHLQEAQQLEQDSSSK